MSIGERLKQLQYATDTSNKALAEYCGVTASAVSAWRLTSSISEQKRVLIARFFNVPLEWLNDGAGELPEVIANSLAGHVREYEPKETPTASGYVSVKEYQILFKAGDGMAIDWQPVDTPYSELWVRSSVLQKNHTRAEKCKAVTVVGDSMQPTLMSGDKVVLETCDALPINCAQIIDGEIYAVAMANGFRIKRIRRIRDGYRLISDNPDYEPEEYTKEATEDIQVFGRAIFVEREL